jgi:hypothetical protein
LIRNQQVAGSNPAVGSSDFNGLVSHPLATQQEMWRLRQRRRSGISDPT